MERADGGAGFAAHVTGSFTLDRDLEELSASDLSKGELQFGLPAALIVLLLVIGTLVGVAIPMLMAIISIVVALAVTAVVGQAFPLNLFVLNMVVAMGLALGIDYSLFIVSRLREERHRGRGTREAILTVAGTATRAVVFSGTAFALAMIAMLLVPDTTLRSLGLGAVIVGVVSVLVALTFHPALLMVLGDRVDRLRVPWLGRRIAASAGEEGPIWRRAVLAVMRRPAISLVATTAMLLALASPVLDLRMGDGGTTALPDSTTAKQGLLALERDFPSGASDPVTIVVDNPSTQQGLTRLRAELANDRDYAAGALTIETTPRLVVASVPLSVEPTSERASAAIDRLRDDYIPRAFGATADHVFVGGAAAEARDGFAVNSRWLPIVIAFVLALSFVLLLLAFRSIAIPLTAIAVNLLSVGAAYGILVLVFQQGVGADFLGFTQVERIDAWIPIFLFSVLFGLSMDYQVFLVSRIHERWSATGDTAGAHRPRRGLHGAPHHRRRGDHHRRLHRVRDRPARRLPGDGLRHRDRARARRDRRPPAAHPGRHGPARRTQLVPASLARVAAQPAGRKAPTDHGHPDRRAAGRPRDRREGMTDCGCGDSAAGVVSRCGSRERGLRRARGRSHCGLRQQHAATATVGVRAAADGADFARA